MEDATLAQSIAVRLVDVISYSPKIRDLTVSNRRASTLLHLVSGQYCYQAAQFAFTAQSGSTIYLPKGSSYRYRVLSQEAECIQITFHLDGSLAHEEPALSIPHPFTDSTCAKRFASAKEHAILEDSFGVLEDLFGILRCMLARDRNPSNLPYSHLIWPAVEYLRRELPQTVSCEDLAQRCGISQSYLRRLFSKHLGMSPIQYKNRMRIQAACRLMEQEGMNGTEAANSLGFPDLYTFSHLFKRNWASRPSNMPKPFGKPSTVSRKPIETPSPRKATSSRSICSGCSPYEIRLITPAP